MGLGVALCCIKIHHRATQLLLLIHSNYNSICALKTSKKKGQQRRWGDGCSTEVHGVHLDFLLPEQDVHQQLNELLHGRGQQRGALPHSPEGLVEQRARGRQLRDPCSSQKVPGAKTHCCYYYRSRLSKVCLKGFDLRYPSTNK